MMRSPLQSVIAGTILLILLCTSYFIRDNRPFQWYAQNGQSTQNEGIIDIDFNTHQQFHGVESRFAYATFLSSRKPDGEDDPYFTAARVLSYQLLHHPTTKTRHNIPLLVLVPNHVSQEKKDILTKEGATVVPIELLNAQVSWTKPAHDGWIDQFAKLRLFTMTQYDRILFIDGDMLLTRSLDLIFEEPVAQLVQKTRDNSLQVKADEAQLPSTYLFVGVYDTGGVSHDSPPKPGRDINGGFWLIRPDSQLFDYYVSVLNIKDRFDSFAMEQSLLNYAHRQDGNMPFSLFELGKWNVNWPNAKDVALGTASLHDKFWDPSNMGWIDRKPVEMWWRMQGMMEGYWQRAQEDILLR